MVSCQRTCNSFPKFSGCLVQGNCHSKWRINTQSTLQPAILQVFDVADVPTLLRHQKLTRADHQNILVLPALRTHLDQAHVEKTTTRSDLQPSLKPLSRNTLNPKPRFRVCFCRLWGGRFRSSGLPKMNSAAAAKKHWNRLALLVSSLGFDVQGLEFRI